MDGNAINGIAHDSFDVGTFQCNERSKKVYGIIDIKVMKNRSGNSRGELSKK